MLAIDPSTVDLSHCTLHMSWWTKQKVYKLIILYSEHHTAECLVAYATVESSYCIVDILNITLHISRSTYSTVDMSHCTLHMHKVHTVHSFKINMFHGGHVSLNIAHVVYYIILHSSGHIERQNVPLHMPRWKAHNALWTHLNQCSLFCKIHVKHVKKTAKMI